MLGDADLAMPLDHPLSVNAITHDTREGPRLDVGWRFAPSLISEEEVRQFAATWTLALEALVRHASQPGAGGLTPSDVDLLELTQADIETANWGAPASRGSGH